MINVLHVLAPAPVGGLESVVRSLARIQAGAGHEVSVVAVLDPGAPDHPLMESLEAHGVGTFTLRPPARAYLRERRMVREVCEATDPDVVHTHGYRPDVLHGAVARKRGSATVTTVHGFTGGGRKNRFYERLQRRAYRRYHAVVAVSRPLRDDLAGRGVPEERLHLVRNGWPGEEEPLDRLEARRRLGVDPDALLVGYVGRLSLEKGADVFVDAAARVATECGFVVVGDGPLRSTLEARGEELGIGDRVFWKGMVEQAGLCMRAFDAFVLSSRTEGTPIALFEAMAAGVPVVAAAVGGVPDIVSSDEAVLVDPDRPAELAAAIDACLADRGEAASRAARARDILHTRFGAQAWLESYDHVYAEALAAAGKVR